MKLPKEISPNPLISSSIEIRFSTDLPKHSLLSFFFESFGSTLPVISQGNVPKQIRDLEPQQFEFAPDYILSNDHYSMSFSDNVVLFDNVGDYKLWGNYSKFVYECVQKLIQQGIFKSITRIGLRYVSIFEFPENQVNTVLKKIPLLDFDGFSENLSLVNTVLHRDNLSLRVQLIPAANVKRGDVSKTGIVIDIDASTMTDQVDLSVDEVIRVIELLHSEEKNLFFNHILNPSFVDTLEKNF